MRGPSAGLRILGLTPLLSGSFCMMPPTAPGADVGTFEPPTGG